MKDKVIGWSEQSHYCNGCERSHGADEVCPFVSTPHILPFDVRLKQFFEDNGFIVFETGFKKEADGYVWTMRVTK
jgi:hypothetical protein